MKGQVQQSRLQNPELKIFTILKILTISDKNEKSKEKSPQRSWPLAKVRAIKINKIFILKVTTKLLADTINYGSQTIYYSSTEPTSNYSWTVLKTQNFQKLHRTKWLAFDCCSQLLAYDKLDIITPQLLSSFQFYIYRSFYSRRGTSFSKKLRARNSFSRIC